MSAPLKLPENFPSLGNKQENKNTVKCINYSKNPIILSFNRSFSKAYLFFTNLIRSTLVKIEEQTFPSYFTFFFDDGKTLSCKTVLYYFHYLSLKLFWLPMCEKEVFSINGLFSTFELWENCTERAIEYWSSLHKKKTNYLKNEASSKQNTPNFVWRIEKEGNTYKNFFFILKTLQANTKKKFYSENINYIIFWFYVLIKAKDGEEWRKLYIPHTQHDSQEATHVLTFMKRTKRNKKMFYFFALAGVFTLTQEDFLSLYTFYRKRSYLLIVLSQLD